MRASCGLKWENKMYKPKRSIISGFRGAFLAFLRINYALYYEML